MTVCKHLTYTGRVQGVGFRWTARQVAGGYAVGGYVRNLPNGSVDLVVEGSADQVEAFIKTRFGAKAGCRVTRRTSKPFEERPQLIGHHVFAQKKLPFGHRNSNQAS